MYRLRKWSVVSLAAILAAATGCTSNQVGLSPGGPVKEFSSQPCWVLQSDCVSLAVTQVGAHIAPVTFYRNDAAGVQPYYISPWQDEHLTHLPAPVLTSLRGDFFCFPFGGNDAAYGTEKHPPHGEVAGSRWEFSGIEKSGAVNTLKLSLKTKVRPGTVTKRISLIDGQNVIYTQEQLTGYTGPMSLGHHATLALPEKEGSVRVAASPFRLGMTCPVLFSDPVNREYQSFAINKRFKDLTQVPLMWKDAPEADATRFPARTGFTDLLAIFSEPAEKNGGHPAWITATNAEAGYLWFSLKDQAILPATVFWISNKGRHGVPWNGRNRCLGLEDVCGYFAQGLNASASQNELNEQGIPTVLQLSPHVPTNVNYIQGVVKIPAGFDVVKSVEFDKEGVTFISTAGPRVSAKLKCSFLQSGKL